MKRQILCIVLPIILTVAGCASTSTQMVNSDGQVANCGAWGVGIIGAPAALISTQNCITKYEAAGYHESGSPQPTGAGSSGQVSVNNSQASLGTPTTILSKDGSFKITLRSGWIQSSPTAVTQQLSAKNTLMDAGLQVSSVNSADIQDWSLYAESLRMKLVGNLNESTSSELRKITVNGSNALQYDIGGTLKNGTKVHYLNTIVRTDKQLVYLVSWCFESRFAANRRELELITAGLQV